MSGEFDKINEFVSYDTIATALYSDELGPGELEIAAKAIQVERAQFVVDAASLELNQRLDTLIGKRATLATELLGTDEQINILANALERPDIVSSNSDTPKIEGEIGTTEAEKCFYSLDNLSKKAALAACEEFYKQVPEFKLSFNITDYGSAVLAIPSTDNEPHMEERLTATVHKNAIRISNVLTRCLAMSDLFGYNDKFYRGAQLVGLGIITDISYSDNRDTLTFTVTKPIDFHNFVMGCTGSGPKTTMALICVADMQARAREQQTLTEALRQT